MADETRTVVTKMELDTKGVEKGTKNVEQKQKKMAKQVKATNKNVEAQNSALGNMTRGLDEATGGMVSMTTGAVKMVKGLKSVRVAVAATGIGALILALTSLFSWFNRTAEGQEAFAKITARLSAIFETLADVASAVGKVIFDAFSNPKQALIDLLNFIKSQVVNRFKALADLAVGVGKVIQAAFKFDFKAVKEELKNLGTAFIQLNTGLDAEQQANLVQNLANKFREIGDNVERNIALQERDNQLRRDGIGFITKQAELQTQISEQRLIANDANASIADRQVAIAQAQLLTNQLVDEQIRLKQEELDIALERDSLFDSNLDDAEELARLEAELILLNKTRADQQRTLLLRATAITAEAEKEVEARAEAEVERQAELDRIELSDEERMKLKFERELEGHKEQAQHIVDIQEGRLAQQRENLERDAELQKQVNESVLDSVRLTARSLALVSKESAVFTVILETATSIAKTFGTLGWPAGIPAALGAAAAGAVQLAVVSNSSIPSFAHGGEIGGQLHSNGGTMIEAERGEVILNRRSMANPMLRSLASQINTAGGGVAFAERGMLVGQNTNQIGALTGDINRIMRANRSILVTEDLNQVQRRVGVTEDTATL